MKKNANIDNELEEICSVSAMAHKLKLSRARFYQLLQDGVFPPPAYCISTKRPLYPRDLQEQCLNIRRRGISASGRPILFYTPRVKNSKASRPNRNQLLCVLTDALGKMGLKVTQKQLTHGLVTLYPKGLPKTDDMGPVIGSLFRHLRKEVSK